ncbi:MAG: hypothetical protein H6732_05465 [Alphaproteobacteria bacterium]|nr:hypothetical protein [Alphaproteobacteria bacterium]
MIAALLALAGWVTVAGAVEVVVVAADGALEPGRSGEVWVGAAEADGRPLPVPPEVRSDDSRWERLPGRDLPGVWAYAVTPEEGVARVSGTVSWGPTSRSWTVPVDTTPAPPALRIETTLGDARRGYARFRVRGDDLPPPDALQVVSSEGRVGRVVAEDGALEVELVTEGSPLPRLVLLGVGDARRSGLPAWGVVRLEGKATVPVPTDPGAVVTVEVGGRTYGPVAAGSTGRAVVELVHLPEETTARVRVRDRFGNEAARPVPLTGQVDPLLLAFVAGPRLPGEPAPEVVLHAVRPDGRPWTDAPPTCRAGDRDVPVVPVGAGTWRVPVPTSDLDGVWDLRVRCTLAGLADAQIAVPVAEGLPVALRVRTYDEVLRTDFPVAELQVTLEDALGQRVVPTGEVQASARFGTALVERTTGPSVRVAYTGYGAVEIGEDAVQVSWTAAPGVGPVHTLRVVGGPLSDEGAAVHVRALDRRLRPLAGEEVTLAFGATTARALAGPDGWASFHVPWSRPGLVAVTAAAGARTVAAVALVGRRPPVGPGQPDLVATVPITVDPGRLAQMQLVADPPLVAAGPRASSTITARLLDRSGNAAEAGEPELEASAGQLTPLGRSDDGTFAWAWIPPPGYRARTIELVARDADLDVEERLTLQVRPREVRRWLGPSAGVQTNFARIVAPFVSLDAAWYVRVGPRHQELPPGRSRLMIRAGVGWYGTQADSDLAGDLTGSVRMDLIPITLALVLRQAYPSQAYWFSLGGVVAPFVGSSAFDGATISRQVGVLPPGLVATAGYGVRVPGGEVAVELRGTVLTSPGSDVSLAGQVGGLAVTLGYRLAY